MSAPHPAQPSQYQNADKDPPPSHLVLFPWPPSTASSASRLSRPLLVMSTAPITLDPSNDDPSPALASSPPPPPLTLDCQTPSLNGLSNELKLRIIDELGGQDGQDRSFWEEGPFTFASDRKCFREYPLAMRRLFKLLLVNKTFGELCGIAMLREVPLVTQDPHTHSGLPRYSHYIRVLHIGDWFYLGNKATLEPEKELARRLAWDEMAAEIVSASTGLQRLRIAFHGLLSRREEDQRNEDIPGVVFFGKTLESLVAGPAADLLELSLRLRLVDWSDSPWMVQLLQTCKRLRRLELLTQISTVVTSQPIISAPGELASIIQGMSDLRGLRLSEPPFFSSHSFLPPSLTTLSLFSFRFTQSEFSELLYPVRSTLKSLTLDKPPRASSPHGAITSYHLTALSSLFINECRFSEALSPLLQHSTSLERLEIGECTWHSFVPSGHSPSLPSLLKSSAPPSLRNLTIGKFAGTSALHWTLRREIFKLREWCTSRRVEAKLPELAEEMWIGLGASESGGLLRAGGGGRSGWESRRARRWRWTGGDERYGDERPGGISLLSIE